MAALLEVTPAGLLSAVGVKEIARRAGVGPSTVYHHFGSLEAFADEVVARVYDPQRFAVGQVTGPLSTLAAADLPAEASKRFHRAEFERLRDDPLFRVRLGLWALGGHSVDKPYGDLLRTIDATIAASAGELFESWNRELRPPIDLAAYVAIQTAMLSGSVVRRLVDPAAMDADRFAQVAAALSLPLLRPRGDRRNLEDQLVELNGYLRRAGPRAAGLDRAASRNQAAPVRVLDAAEECFRREGYGRVTVAQVARAAEVSASTVYHHFAGLPELAVSLLVRRFRDLHPEQATPARTADDAPGTQQLADAVAEVAQFCSARADHLAPYAAYLALGPDRDDPLVGRIAAHLPSGVESDLAESVVLVLVGSLVASPARGEAHAAQRALMLIRGAGVVMDEPNCSTDGAP